MSEANGHNRSPSTSSKSGRSGTTPSHNRRSSVDSGVSLIEAQPGSRRCFVTGYTVNPQPWSLFAADWRFVLSAAHWGTVILILISVLISASTCSLEPTKRDFVLDDPSLRHTRATENIPAAVQYILPIVLFVGMVLLGEFYLFKPCHELVENGITTFLFFLFDWASAMLMVLVWNKITILVVGRPTPDYHDLCGEPGGNGSCAENTLARQSFFPVAPAMAMMTAIYNANYVVFLVYNRARLPPYVRNNSRTNSGTDCPETGVDRALEQIGHAALMYFILIEIAAAWVVSISKIINHRNFVSDVNTAMLIGGIIGFVFSHRANNFQFRLKRKEPEVATTTRKKTSGHSRSSSSRPSMIGSIGRV